jgi:anaerobic selenocysteine-containing dehydrogenase
MPKETADKMIGLKEYPAYCNAILDAHADLVLEALETEKPYPLRLGYYAGNNLLAATCAAQPKRWRDAMLKSLDFCFTLDCFITPSAQATCDLILPLAVSAEREGTVANHYGATPTYMGITNKAIEGPGMSDTEFCYELGKRLNPKVWTKYETLYDYIKALRFGNRKTFFEAREEVNIQAELEYRKYETGHLRQDGRLGFNTPTGRFEFYSTLFQSFGDDPLPYYDEPQYSPIQTPELLGDYPYVLTTGARVYAFFHSENRQIPFCRELNPDPLVEIHPETARKKGIADGQWVRIWNQFGSCKMKAMLTIAVDENTIHAQHGWWFPEANPDKSNPLGEYNVWLANINELVPHFHVGKMGWGAPFKCLLCNVEPLNENYDTVMQEIWDKFGKLVR